MPLANSELLSLTLHNLEKLQQLKSERKLFQYSPYQWQKDFHNCSAQHSERMLMAANQVGKTHSAGAEVAMHATGLYPEWYEGKKFHKPKVIWVASKTNEDCRDIAQDKLLGGLDENGRINGTGLIPKSCIGKHKIRQAGIGDVIDYVDIIWNENGKPTDHKVRVQFKSYEQGWKKFQGRVVDLIWLDEEPDEQKVFTECIARTTTSGGLILVTFTPLSGRTDMVEYFLSGDHNCYVKNATIHDAEHLSPERIEEMIKKYPSHERDARTKGIPMMGQGRVFSIDEETIKCAPFQVPDYFFQIIGIDFGWDHPNATSKLAWDRDTDILYVVDAEKQRERKHPEHAARIKGMGGDVYGFKTPVAWPHDGENRRDGVNMKTLYAAQGVSLLSDSARYDDDKGGPQVEEPIIQEVYERMVSGRFKVFNHLSDWFEEFRNYHRIIKKQEDRDTVKIVARRDDILKSTFYAVMMKRYAAPRYFNQPQHVSVSYLS